MPTVQQNLGLSDEQFGKLRLFNRILISYNDFKQAHKIAALILDGDLYRNYPTENLVLVIALNMAAVVAYSRPFINSGSDLAHNRLPGRVLRILNAEELELHETVIKNRNTMMAHSDADANVSIPLVMETDHWSGGDSQERKRIRNASDVEINGAPERDSTQTTRALFRSAAGDGAGGDFISSQSSGRNAR
jgi:hypothetical protein